MNFPTEQQLREWWQEEQKFYDTRLGRMFGHLKHELWRVEKERDHYKKLVLDYAATLPDAAEFLRGTAAEQTNCDTD